MSTLRVLLAAPPSRSRPASWALFDDAGRCVQRGSDAPDGWPRGERCEAVLAAEVVRVVALKVPPMPPTRLAAAAAFALEDQLATTGDAPTIAVSAQQADGTVLACVAARDAIAAVVAREPPFDRIIAEPALAPIHTGWTWYASGAQGGFVRRADGSAFAVGSNPAPSELPAELVAALTQAARAGASPRLVGVAQACDDATLARWTRELGIPFTRVAPWRWDNATPEAIAAAPDMRVGEFARVLCNRRESLGCFVRRWGLRHSHCCCRSAQPLPNGRGSSSTFGAQRERSRHSRAKPIFPIPHRRMQPPVRLPDGMPICATALVKQHPLTHFRCLHARHRRCRRCHPTR